MARGQTRKLVAILAADIAGYSALMGVNEERTVRDLKAHQAVVLPMIGKFRGRIIDIAGDGILAEFASVVNAVECAVAIQAKMAERNTSAKPERRMQFRIGVNLGDVIYDDERLYGDGINIAARLEGIAEPGGICISHKVYEEVSGRINLACDDLGAQQLKNIARPVHVYRVRLRRPMPDGSPANDGPMTVVATAVSRIGKSLMGDKGNELSPRQLVPLRIFATYAMALVIALSLAHYIIVMKLDLHPAVLRVFSLLLPMFAGFVLSRQTGHGLGTAFLLGATTGILSVLAMVAIVGMLDAGSIVPSSRLEWQEAIEYVIGITLATVIGSALARAVNLLRSAS